MEKFVGRRKMGAYGRMGLPDAVRTIAGITEDTVFDVYYDVLKNRIILVPVAVSRQKELAHAES